ncbi:mitotic-spindle organizing gamma-tubulin ring associated-domain-containing protein, partial [Dimargaris cristalligena]
EDRRLQSRETVDLLDDMSGILNTGLSREALVLCTKLCEMGVNPEALASVVKELQRE